jgi:guanine deaminase
MKLLKLVFVFVVMSICALAHAEMRAVKGSLLSFTNDPFVVGDEKSYHYIPDGVMLINDGKIVEIGKASQVKIPEGVVTLDYSGHLITAGFVDTHIHYPQTEMIASYGEQLLDWLNKYTFPTEEKFKDKEYARGISKIFLNELLKNGTTTALVFGTVHKQSVDAFFEEADKLNLRMIAGKVMMDNPATTPDFLRDTAQTSYDDSRELILKWHGKNRLLYAITPRFAITSTRDQLKMAGQLKAEFPSVYVHTHVSENLKEVAFTQELFPEAKGYLDVYDQYGLLTNHSIFAHGVHLTESEFQRLHDTGSSISHCPTSNLFLGSGLFNLYSAVDAKRPVKVGMGTDVGAGTSFSMLTTMNEAYKIQQLQGQKLSPFKAFYLATLGSAKALDLDSKIGSLEKGKEADFVVLDLANSNLQYLRMAHASDLHDQLFALMILGDDRNILTTFANGERVYQRP